MVAKNLTKLAVFSTALFTFLYAGCTSKLHEIGESKKTLPPVYIFPKDYDSLDTHIYDLDPEKNFDVLNSINNVFGDSANFSTDIKLFYNSNVDTLEYITVNSSKINKQLLKSFLPDLVNDLESNKYGVKIK